MRRGVRGDGVETRKLRLLNYWNGTFYQFLKILGRDLGWDLGKIGNDYVCIQDSLWFHIQKFEKIETSSYPRALKRSMNFFSDEY